MTLESSLWANFRAALPVSAHAVRIENSVELGTPDVDLCLAARRGLYSVVDVVLYGLSCVPGREYEQYRDSFTGWEGWVELKVQVAPKRKSTTFRCDHFTMEQRQWLVRRTRAGGNAYLLMQVDQGYLWLRGDIAAIWIGSCTLDELKAKCDWCGDSLIKLVEWLQM